MNIWSIYWSSLHICSHLFASLIYVAILWIIRMNIMEYLLEFTAYYGVMLQIYFISYYIMDYGAAAFHRWAPRFARRCYQ